VLNGPWTFGVPRQLRFRLSGGPPVYPPADMRNLLDLDVEILTSQQDHKR